MKKYSALILILVVIMTGIVVVALTFALKSASRQNSTQSLENNLVEENNKEPEQDLLKMEEPLKIFAKPENTGEFTVFIKANEVEVNAFALRVYISESMGNVVFTPSAELVEAGWVFPVNEITEDEQRSVDVAAAYVSPEAYPITGGELIMGTLMVENLDTELNIDEDISKVVSKDGKIYPLEFVSEISTQ